MNDFLELAQLGSARQALPARARAARRRARSRARLRRARRRLLDELDPARTGASSGVSQAGGRRRDHPGPARQPGGRRDDQRRPPALRRPARPVHAAASQGGEVLDRFVVHPSATAPSSASSTRAPPAPASSGSGLILARQRRPNRSPSPRKRSTTSTSSSAPPPSALPRRAFPLSAFNDLTRLQPLAVNGEAQLVFTGVTAGGASAIFTLCGEVDPARPRRLQAQRLAVPGDRARAGPERGAGILPATGKRSSTDSSSSRSRRPKQPPPRPPARSTPPRPPAAHCCAAPACPRYPACATRPTPA